MLEYSAEVVTETCHFYSKIKSHLCEIKQIRNKTYHVPGLVVILLPHTEYREGCRHQGRYVKSKLLKTPSFIVVEPLAVH